ncbi:MAG: hypothetical protein Q8L11_00005 [Candidatus Moranbacteria bacterium]|nr:hypothetical protein [Candidatus Moranbacteria bacterium]
MKIYSGKTRLIGFVNRQERFKLKSFDPKIIERYGSLDEFFWKITLGYVPDEMRKPVGFYTVNNRGDQEISVHYNQHQLNTQMLMDFFNKIGIEVELSKVSEIRMGWRKEREELFGKQEESLKPGQNGLVVVSFFQIIPEESDPERYPIEFNGFIECDDIRDKREEYGKNGLYDLSRWRRKNIIFAEYSENLISDEDIITYCKEKFGMVVKADLQR